LNLQRKNHQKHKIIAKSSNTNKEKHVKDATAPRSISLETAANSNASTGNQKLSAQLIDRLTTPTAATKRRKRDSQHFAYSRWLSEGGNVVRRTGKKTGKVK
jgi:hypothetical protein